jgi:glyoxylase-like metal-dependent hydrolase (beta-lactamase superfamily II)
MEVVAFYDRPTGTVSYIVADAATQQCAVIDSVLDYDGAAARISTASADRILAEIGARGLTCTWLLETHVHADHLSAAGYLRRATGAPIGIGRQIGPVQKTFAALFDLGGEFPTDGRQFDRLFEDGESFAIGGLTARVMHTPGHTSACSTYLIEDCAFVGDTLFMPDFGTARCDFPGGDAATLYRSIRRILDLPPQTRIFTGHDYPPDGRAPAWESTVAEQRARNVHVGGEVAERDFASMRAARDATLAMPALILPAVQVNIRAGDLPEPAANGRRYLKLPVDTV